MAVRFPRRLVRTVVALCLTLLAACGGADEHERAAADILQQTFRSDTSEIEDAYLSLSVRLDPEGPRAGGGPLLFTLLGPFSRGTGGGHEQFDVEFAATLAEQQYVATVRSTGERRLVTLDGETFELDDGRRRSPGASRRTGMPVTGFDPLHWISGAAIKGNERAVGVNTVRIGGRVDVARLLGDLDRMFTSAGGSASGRTLLSPRLRRQVAGAVKSSWIDIWSGAPDRLLRQIAVRFVFSFGDGDSPLPWLTGGKVNLHLRLDDVNESAVPASTFAEPRGRRARPLAELTGGSAAEIVEGVGAGLAGSRRRELAACLDAANGSSSALARCISRRSRDSSPATAGGRPPRRR